MSTRRWEPAIAQALQQHGGSNHTPRNTDVAEAVVAASEIIGTDAPVLHYSWPVRHSQSPAPSAGPIGMGESLR